MDGYKIGSVSSVFGISNDTIRYYESRGIITPKRDEESGYRYYDSWDINYLLDCLRFRSYDFPIAEIEQMIKSDDIDDVEQKIRVREAALIAEVEEKRNILKRIAHLRRSLYRIRTQLGEFVLEESPEMIWHPQREKIISEEGELLQGPGAKTVREWVRHMLFLEHTFLMPALKDAQEFNEYSWGFSLSPQKLQDLGLKMPKTAVYLPRYQSIYTIFEAGDMETFMPSIREQVLDPVRAKGFRIANPPVGNLLVRVHENGKMRRYFEVWVPIE